MNTIQEICASKGYNYKSNHSKTYRNINSELKQGVEILLQKTGTVKLHDGRPYNLTIKYEDITLRSFHSNKNLLDSKILGEIITNKINIIKKE